MGNIRLSRRRFCQTDRTLQVFLLVTIGWFDICPSACFCFYSKPQHSCSGDRFAPNRSNSVFCRIFVFFKGFEIGNVSIVAATMNLWAVFTMLFAFIFMGERLSTIQALGVLMIISGVTLASLNWSDIRNQRFQLTSGVKEAVLGAFFFGVFWNISEVVSEEIRWLLTTLFVKFGIVLFLLIFSLLVKREIGLTKTTTKTKYMVVLMGMIEAGAVAAVNYGLTIGDAILITPIASALSIVTITLAVIFFKDKVSKLQGLGIVMAIVGIIVTAF